MGEILLTLLVMSIGMLLLYFGLKGRRGCCNDTTRCIDCPEKDKKAKDSNQKKP